MEGKTIVITGTTSGIGYEMAKQLALAGNKVIMACRNIEKAKKVKNEITNIYDKSLIDILEIDLASFKSIQQFVHHFNSKYNHIDALINNAGVYADRLTMTEDGFENTMGVNYIGPYLLTRLLLPCITRNPNARIINITSKAAFHGKLTLDDNMFKSKIHGFKAYSASKLAQIYFTIDLAEQLKDTGITVNAAYPGRVATNIWNGDTLLMKIVAPIMNRKSISAELGAKTGVYLATSDNVNGVTGKMFDGEQIVDYPPKCLDEQIRTKLMEISNRVIEDKDCK